MCKLIDKIYHGKEDFEANYEGDVMSNYSECCSSSLKSNSIVFADYFHSKLLVIHNS